MPMHDWSKVAAGIYHDFHNLWLHGIRHTLNDGLLPPGYYALTEQRTGMIEADLLTLTAPKNQLPPIPDVEEFSLSTEGVATALLERESKVRTRYKTRRVSIRHISDHKVVAVLELVSPENKSSREKYAEFVNKAGRLLEAGIHLLVIDPFAPPRFAKRGLHHSIWRNAARRRKDKVPFAVAPEQPLLAVSYCATRKQIVAAIQPFAIGEPAPTMPLFLTAEEASVALPLETTYRSAFLEVPKVWREALDKS